MSSSGHKIESITLHGTACIQRRSKKSVLDIPGFSAASLRGKTLSIMRLDRQRLEGTFSA